MRIEGLGQIARAYGGVLMDQWGVLHDGRRLYPGAAEVMERLHQASIPVVVLTNSGKRAEANRKRLEALGLRRELFVEALSSGEVAYRRLLGNAAGKLLILGSDAPDTPLERYGELLRGATAPAVCCNPDRLMLTEKGLQPAPGAIAALYESQGGKVSWIGKPHPDIYTEALKLIGNPAKVLCIGDSAEHDVAGGKSVGLDTLLVRTGVSRNLDSFTPQPDYVMDALTW
jgi:ribonucleotide monophosphatase NagD (HAD superfamily)